MPNLLLPAPAKINLFLHILGRRADGYHELQTVFQLLDVGDELSFTRRDNGAIEFTCSDPGLEGLENLVVKAAEALEDYRDTSLGVSIHLQKNLPVGGGIGGGSSDAATTLLALNALWQCGLSVDELAALGRELGADVPVFIYGHSAWAEGIGEKLQAIEIPEIYYLVLTPDCSVSTASVFTHPELTRDTTPITVAAFFEQGGGATAHNHGATNRLRNDCQSLVAKLHPEVAEVIDWLGQFAQAQMTGTGASVFAPFATQAEALAVLDKSPWRGFVAKGINRSPVHQILGMD